MQWRVQTPQHVLNCRMIGRCDIRTVDGEFRIWLNLYKLLDICLHLFFISSCKYLYISSDPKPIKSNPKLNRIVCMKISSNCMLAQGWIWCPFFTCPLVGMTVRAPLLIWQPALSTLPYSLSYSSGRSVSLWSTLWCCPPISFSTCLSFSSLYSFFLELFW